MQIKLISLKKCKQRLEESSKNAHKTNTELKDYMAKVITTIN